MNKLYGTDKKLYICDSSYIIQRNLGKTKDFVNIFDYSNSSRLHFKRPTKSVQECEQKFKQNLYTGKIGNKIYFHPNSEFPRFKLMGTDFKRTIKPDKADVIVVPEYTNIYSWASPYFIYEDDNHDLYAITEYVFSSYFKSSDQFIDSVKKWNNISLKFKEQTALDHTALKYEYVLDVINSKFNKPVITDNMLDLEISKTLTTITESDIDSINSMLASRDPSVVELGLKTLAGFNVFATPTIIKTLLCMNYDNIQYNKAMSSVSVRKLLNSVDMFRSHPGRFPGWMYCLADPNDKFSDFEITQVKRLLMPLYKDYVEKNMFRTRDANAPFIPKLTYTIE